MADLTHLDERGQARMVDVSDKTVTDREAVAKGLLLMAPETLALVRSGGLPKGDVLGVARVAGILAAKRTADLIPLCHPLPLTAVSVAIEPESAGRGLEITATCRTSGRTGVEMEALTAAAVAGLTLYDMCKAVDRGLCLTEVRLVHKTGGRSGTWTAEDGPAVPAAG